MTVEPQHFVRNLDPDRATEVFGSRGWEAVDDLQARAQPRPQEPAVLRDGCWGFGRSRSGDQHDRLHLRSRCSRWRCCRPRLFATETMAMSATMPPSTPHGQRRRFGQNTAGGEPVRRRVLQLQRQLTHLGPHPAARRGVAGPRRGRGQAPPVNPADLVSVPVVGPGGREGSPPGPQQVSAVGRREWVSDGACGLRTV